MAQAAIAKRKEAMTKGTKQRSIRIDDALWDEAQQTARRLGDNLSFIIRDKLREYAEDNQKEQ